MSTLVVVKKNGYATIACDSLSTDGSITVCPENKLNNHKFFKHGNSFIGLVGWSNFNDILENILKDESSDLEFSNSKSTTSHLSTCSR